MIHPAVVATEAPSEAASEPPTLAPTAAPTEAPEITQAPTQAPAWTAAPETGGSDVAALVEKMNQILSRDDLFQRDDPRVSFVRELILK